MSHLPKKIKLSDLGETDEVESGCYMKFNYRDFKEYMTPVIKARDRDSLGWFREYCDFCMEPIDENDDDPPIGGIFTVANADKIDGIRDYAKSCLKFYNDTKGTTFELVKVWKFNSAPQSYHLTFSAQEDIRGECPLFRGVVNCLPKKAVFCEIKNDDEIELLPTDDDYAPCHVKVHDSPLDCSKKDVGSFAAGTVAG